MRKGESAFQVAGPIEGDNVMARLIVSEIIEMNEAFEHRNGQLVRMRA